MSYSRNFYAGYGLVAFCYRGRLLRLSLSSSKQDKEANQRDEYHEQNENLPTLSTDPADGVLICPPKEQGLSDSELFPSVAEPFLRRAKTTFTLF